MGQAGSQEQRNTIRDVLLLKPGSDAQDRAAVVAALDAFCKMFPLEQLAVVEAADAATFDLRERRVFDVIHALLQQWTEHSEKNAKEDLIMQIELALACFKRVLLWRELYRMGAKCSVKPFLNCLLLSPRLAVSAMEVVLKLIGASPGTEANEKTERWETANRRNFADGGGFQVLQSLLVQNCAETQRATTSESELLLSLVLEAFHTTLVARRQSTDALTCSQAAGALVDARIRLLDLCHHPNHEVQDTAVDLVRILFFLIDLEQVHDLQEAAREYGALLYALYAAVGDGPLHRRSNDAVKGTDTDSSQSTPSSELPTLQDKCIDLIEMFCAGNSRSKKAMCKIFPVELFNPAEYGRKNNDRPPPLSSSVKELRSTRSLPAFNFDFDARAGDSRRIRPPTMSTQSKQVGIGAFERWFGAARAQGENWRAVMEAVLRTHEQPELVWREEMRQELCSALRDEIAALSEQRANMAANQGVEEDIVRWDHEMFYVDYKSIQKELFVNGYFVEHLVTKIADLTSEYEVVEPVVLVWHLSDRLAVETNEAWRILCLRCLRLVVRRYAMVLNGQLPMRHILQLLSTRAKLTPACICEALLLLKTAILTTKNIPSESLHRSDMLIASAVMEVLSDSVLISKISRSHDGMQDDDEDLMDFDEEEITIHNIGDDLVRAGISVLQAVIRRSKFALVAVRPRRVFLCRLLAVETLDHVTIARILAVLKQVSQLDVGIGSQKERCARPAVDANWRSLALVYVLHACCDPRGQGMSLSAAEFLKENFATESTTEVMNNAAQSAQGETTRTSALHKSEFAELLDKAVGYDGCGMGALLETCDPAVLCEIFNSEQKRAADVLWGRTQRAVLFKYLKRNHVSSGSEAPSPTRSQGAAAVDLRTQAIAIGDIYVGNIFLRSFIEGDGEFLNKWTPEKFSTLIRALFKHLVDLAHAKSVFGINASDRDRTESEARTEPWEIQVLILKALVKLLPTHCAVAEVTEQYYETLLLPLHRSLLGETDQIRAVLALELIIAILCVPEDQGGRNVQICRQYLEQKGLQLVGDAFSKMLQPSYQRLLSAECSDPAKNPACLLLFRGADILSTLSAQPEGVSVIVKNAKVMSRLLDLSTMAVIMQSSHEAVKVCLMCLANLCHYDALRDLFVESGGLLIMIETCVFCPAEDAVEVSASEEERTSDTEMGAPAIIVRRRPTPAAEAVRAAAMVLRVCLEETEMDEQAPTFQVLRQLLTPCALRVLRRSPDAFILRLQSAKDIHTPTLIWTNSMRVRLRDTLTLELTKVQAAARANAWPRWNPEHFVAADSFRYQYPELTDELIVNDVYLHNFVSATGDVDLEDVDMSALSQTLLISIQSGENVLRILKQRGASDPNKEKSIVVMRLALNKLVTAHPQHNLEVVPTPSTAMAITTMVESESSSEDEDDDAASSVVDSPKAMDPDDGKSQRSSCLEIEDMTV